METMDLEGAQRWCREWESSLRSLFGESRELPPAWEEELAKYPATALKSALFRWAQLRHFYQLRQQEKSRPKAPPKETLETVRDLLTRKPVRLTLSSGRQVQITSRSYAAMAEIATHSQTIRDLERALATVSEDMGAEAVRRVQYELLLHRRAIWAHLLTPSGAPAESVDDCPEWWREITPRDDAAMLAAALEVGAGRYAKLPEPPAPKKGKPKGEDFAEDFGWGSLFACVERELKLPPATLYDRDLYQLLAWRRAGAHAPPELDS